jgi:protein gp37
MAQTTAIAWADSTFNPWVGCTKISAACDHCYAESWAKRAGNPELWQGERRRTSASNWAQPIKWDRQAKAEGVRRKVFCASLADVFDNQVPERWRYDLWALIAATPNLDWLLLTKRPQNIAKMLPEGWAGGWSNVWLGVTVENQDAADLRIPYLMAIPAAVRFLSCEPLLGPLDLYNGDPDPRLGGHQATKTFIGDWWEPGDSSTSPSRHGVDWVIAGGESGPNARPSNPNWFFSLRDQCDVAEVPFFFKQWGGRTPASGGSLLNGMAHKQFPVAVR